MYIDNKMNTIDYLSTLHGHGTSMITMAISTNKAALTNATTLLNTEYSVSANIKSRV